MALSTQRRSFDATVIDSIGPLWRRLLVPAISGVLAGVAFALPSDFVSAGFFTAVALFLAGPLLAPRSSPKRTLVVCETGVVKIGKRKLIAGEVVGATTAWRDGKLSVALALKRRNTPIILELEGPDDLRVLCRALGIGHHGFGTVRWDARTMPSEKGEAWSRGIGGGLLLVLVVMGLLHSFTDDALWLVMFDVMAIFFAFLFWIIRSSGVRDALELTPNGINVYSSGRFQATIPYAEIGDVIPMSDALVVAYRNPKHPALRLAFPASRWLRGGMSPLERGHFAAQVNAAGQRARGNVALKEQVEATIDTIRRRDEPMSAWLARIDSLGVSFGGGSSYRIGAFDAGELWKLFEDPEEEADARGAAARILARVSPEDAKVRIDPILSTVRDDKVRTRIATVIEVSPSHADAVLEEDDEPKEKRRRVG